MAHDDVSSGRSERVAGPRHHHDVIGDDAVAAPLLAAVEDVAVAVLSRPRVDRGDVGAGLWLGYRDRRDDAALGDDRQVFGALLFGAFGGIALLLAVIGVYGVKAYAVACRTREIGIRMALGAHRRDIFALIMRQGAMQTALAVAIGLLLCLAAGRVLSQILYEVSPNDPFALVTSGVLLAVAALLACFFPARRATRVEPLQALRTE